jgi:RNA polymerase sigma-70 factor (ECF subfamily)
MAEATPNFKTLMQRLRDGDESAAQQLVDKYGEYIIFAVRRKLDQKLRRLFDSVDFVQAVWASFFAVAPGQYDFERPEKLVKFLTSMAQNKVVDAVRERLLSQKRDLNREEVLSESITVHTRGLRSTAPGPEEVAMAREQWEVWLRSQPSQYRTIIERVANGQSQEAVAQELGVADRTVRRALERLSSDVAHESE